MHIGLIYDLRDDYRALGFSEEEIAEFDSVETIDQLEGALRALGCTVTRVGRGQKLATRFAAGERFDFVVSIAEGLSGRSREAQVPALCELFDQPCLHGERRHRDFDSEKVGWRHARQGRTNGELACELRDE